MSKENTQETKNSQTAGSEPKMVKIKLQLDRQNKDNQDVFVSVNGRTWMIKRGVEIEVPDYVAEVLDWANESEEREFAYLRQLEEKTQALK